MSDPAIALLPAGASAEASLVVQPSDTAEALRLTSEDEFPAVFATSRMVALMELAAARAMKPLLKEGELSVGVAVEIRHVAATALGQRVRAVAQYEGREGKLHRFRVEAFDEGGSIGAGEHTRAIVETGRLLAGAARRAQARSET